MSVMPCAGWDKTRNILTVSDWGEAGKYKSWLSLSCESQSWESVNDADDSTLPAGTGTDIDQLQKAFVCLSVVNGGLE